MLSTITKKIEDIQIATVNKQQSQTFVCQSRVFVTSFGCFYKENLFAFVSYCLLLPEKGVVNIHEIVKVQFSAKFDRMNKFWENSL